VKTEPHDSLAGNPVGPVVADIVDRCGLKVSSDHPRLARFHDASVSLSIGKNPVGGNAAAGRVRALLRQIFGG
jgi:hypothetical protein